MEKTYNPGDIETDWYDKWETEGYFKPLLNFNESVQVTLVNMPCIHLKDIVLVVKHHFIYRLIGHL